MKGPTIKRASSAVMTLAVLLFGTASVSAYVFERVQDDKGNWRKCDVEDSYGIKAPNLQVIFDRSKSMLEPSGVGGGPYSTTSDVTKDGQTDVGLVKVPAGARDNPTNRDALSLSNKVEIPPYIWVVNTQYNTLSKLNAESHREEGRYAVGWNPSRTAVDLDSNAWVGTRQDGMLSKILVRREACPDRNGNGVIDTSTGTNVLPLGRDECIVYQDIPRAKYWNSGHRRYMGATIRGLAAGPDGKMWIGYSSHGYGLQSIDVATFQKGPYVTSNSIQRWNKDRNGVLQPTGSRLSSCGAYGMVLDKEGRLYYSNWCRDRLPAYDTRAKRWIANYYIGDRCLYGITTDAKSRIWLACWYANSGVRVFDPATRRVTNFPSPHGRTIGLGTEPETGDVWGSFYQASRVGRLKVDENNLSNSRWQYIVTPRGHWGGVGFDGNGFAWNVGYGANQAYKINPATNRVVASVNVGQGRHYVYSDFTGSTANGFTAPSGRWNNVYPIGVPGQIISKVKVEAYVPPKTSVGVRFRALDRNGNAVTTWYPPEINGSAQFFPYTTNAAAMQFPAPQGNDNPFLAEQLEVDIKLATQETGVRPFLFNVTYDTDNSKPSFQAAQDIVVGLSNAANIPGQCTEQDATKCDYLRVGLSYFDSTYQQVTTTGEDTAGNITQSVATATADGLTNLSTVAQQIATMPSLQDPDRENYVLVVTDGRVNKTSTMVSSINSLCQANKRATAPVQTYAMALGYTSDLNINSLLAAAGGTGHCCVGANANCAPAQRFDVCDTAALTPYLRQVGTAPYTQVQLRGMTCSGTLTALDITSFKTQMLAKARESSSKFGVEISNDPQMYNKPTYPQKGLLPDPNATKVVLHHAYWNKVELPFCDPATMTDCGLAAELVRNGVSPLIAAQFKDQGWYFADATKREVVRVTPLLADEIAARRVKKTTIQAACQCFKPEGTPCDVPGYDSPELVGSRCAPGKYACNAQAFDTCVPNFRAMPEICNGRDDDCNGFSDDISDKRKPTKYGPGVKWSSVNPKPDDFDSRSELVCDFENICVCDLESTDSDAHLGKGETFTDELNDYFNKSFDAERTCLCGEGLKPVDVKELTNPNANSQSNDSSAEPQAGGCSSTQSGGGSAALFLVFFSLFFFRRRRQRD